MQFLFLVLFAAHFSLYSSAYHPCRESLHLSSVQSKPCCRLPPCYQKVCFLCHFHQPVLTQPAVTTHGHTHNLLAAASVTSSTAGKFSPHLIPLIPPPLLPVSKREWEDVRGGWGVGPGESRGDDENERRNNKERKKGSNERRDLEEGAAKQDNQRELRV